MAVDMTKIDFAALAGNPLLMWHDVRKIDWDSVPVTGSSDHVNFARHVAGLVRNFAQFYTREERDYAMSLERWLTRYSAEYTHWTLRK